MSNILSNQMEYVGHDATQLNWREILKMLKPVVALLVIITSLPSMIIATGEFPSFSVVMSVTLGIFLTSAAGSIINQVIDYDIDSRMYRTSDRLIPSYKLSRSVAFWSGTLMLLAGCAILYFFASPVSALVALLADLFYLLFYTMYLKRRTPQNIVIGGAAGAVGPLIGWYAVTDQTSVLPWLMFALIFFWTPPHFWALALRYREDYAAASVPMLPVVRGERTTKLQMLLYSLVLIPVVYKIFVSVDSHWLVMLVMLFATIWFSWMCFDLWKSKVSKDPMPVFQYSCIYLFFVFFGLTLEQCLRISGW